MENISCRISSKFKSKIPLENNGTFKGPPDFVFNWVENLNIRDQNNEYHYTSRALQSFLESEKVQNWKVG